MSRSPRFPDWQNLGEKTQRIAAGAALDLAERLQSRLHAFVSLASSLPAPGEGELAGMPYAIKDIFATMGRHPTSGLDHGLDLGHAGDAEALARLDKSGAIRIGFCTMTELAFEPSGYSTSQIQARNPWNADFITGGSSSGSAVAVASGAVNFALGSDTGGSIRIPAQACGVTALKPTFGAISTQGAIVLAPTLDTIGILARSAADLGAPARILIGYKPDPRPVERIVVLADLLAAAEPAIRHAFEAGIDAIAATGIEVERSDASAAIEAIDKQALLVLQGEPARVHRARLDDASLNATLRKRLAKGLAIDDDTLAASRSTRMSLSESFLQSVLGDADAAVLPVMPIRTPQCIVCDPTSLRFDARTVYRLSQWTRFVNMLGFPAVALPVGFDDNGMPVALQIVGRPGADLALIGVAAAVQNLTDWHGRIPAGIVDLVAEAKFA